MYSLVLDNFIKSLLPNHRRGKRAVGVAKVLFQPLASNYAGQELYRDDINFRAIRTGQVVMIQAALSRALGLPFDLFDVRDSAYFPYDFMVSIPTTIPAETVAKIIDIVQQIRPAGRSFGVVRDGVITSPHPPGYEDEEDPDDEVPPYVCVLDFASVTQACSGTNVLLSLSLSDDSNKGPYLIRVTNSTTSTVIYESQIAGTLATINLGAISGSHTVYAKSLVSGCEKTRSVYITACVSNTCELSFTHQSVCTGLERTININISDSYGNTPYRLIIKDVANNVEVVNTQVDSFYYSTHLPGLNGNYEIKVKSTVSNCESVKTFFYQDCGSLARSRQWIADENSAVCVKDGSNNNTGMKKWNTLKEMYTDVSPNVPTGQTKPNVSTDPNYIAPVPDTTYCPISGGNGGTPSTETARHTFTPTTQKGDIGWTKFPEFSLPASKFLWFVGAGRNLARATSGKDVFNWGFTAVDKSRMVSSEVNNGDKAVGWTSPLPQSKRVFWIGASYFTQAAFSLAWANNSRFASSTYYERPSGDPNYQNALGQACRELGGLAPYWFKDNNQWAALLIDIENDGIEESGLTANEVAALKQEQANLYVHMMAQFKGVLGSTLVGSIAPTPKNCFGWARQSDYGQANDWLWEKSAQQIGNSVTRGMPSTIVDKRFNEYPDYIMPGGYFFYEDFQTGISHSSDGDRHWLANILFEQEVNSARATKPRIPWVGLFNFAGNGYLTPPSVPRFNQSLPADVAEGLAIFYWFTGIKGMALWDDAGDLTPNTTTLPTDNPGYGVGNDRYYTAYEHFIHGLWRLFANHSDVFDGNEQYLNANTEVSYDGGVTWLKLNAAQIKNAGLPFVRQIVNGNKILIAAQHPFQASGQTTTVKTRYNVGGANWQDDISMTGSTVYLKRATMIIN